MPPTRTVEVLGPELEGREGVLPNQHLEQLVADGVVVAPPGAPIPPGNIQPASLDLRLGPVAYRLRCSFLPGPDRVEKRINYLKMGEVDLQGGGGALEVNRPYLIPLQESLRLPIDMRAKANPKSSTGRADVFTRVITDHSYGFDEIALGYHGSLYLEVVPLSFPISIRAGLALNQIRFSIGRASLTDQALVAAHKASPLLYDEAGAAIPEEDLPVSGGLLLGVNLRGVKLTRMGWRAKESPPLLDMTKIRGSAIDRYWERIRTTPRPDCIILRRKKFYLLMSNEAVCIPPDLAAEMTAYDPTNGELRTHYAGFFDPGFGYDRRGGFSGSTAALEVRAHDVDFMIEHGQRVCKLTFERMVEPPTKLYGEAEGSNYQRQAETVGKHFKLRPRRPDGSSDRLGDDTDDQLPLFELENERS